MKPSILYNFASLAPRLNFLAIDRAIGSVSEILGSGESDSSTKWPELQVLNCARNYITNIDTSLVGLSALEVLDLSYNLISKVENLQFCFRLVHLNLAHNRIRSVENTVAALGNLRVLNLASNGLESAYGLEKLLGLERLDISENQLMQPLDIARLSLLPNLTQLELRANPLTSIAKWRTQVFTLLLKDDIVIDGHGPSSSDKKAIETKRAETPIVPYAGHSTISKIGTIVTERPAFSSYGRALPSENLDPTMAYEYPDLKPDDRKITAEVAVTAPPLHIRPKITSATVIASSPSSSSQYLSSSPSTAASSNSNNTAAAAFTAAQKRKQKNHKRRAIADIADPSQSPTPDDGKHGQTPDSRFDHHFEQATNIAPESSNGTFDPQSSVTTRSGDGLSPIGDEKELGQILAWAAEDRWLLNYNAYRQRIDEQEAKLAHEQAKAQAADESNGKSIAIPSGGTHHSADVASSAGSTIHSGSYDPSADTVSSSGSGLLRRKLPEVRRQTLVMPSAFSAELISEMEAAGGVNMSNADFERIMSKVDRPKSAPDATQPKATEAATLATEPTSTIKNDELPVIQEAPSPTSNPASAPSVSSPPPSITPILPIQSNEALEQVSPKKDQVEHQSTYSHSLEKIPPPEASTSSTSADDGKKPAAVVPVASSLTPVSSNESTRVASMKLAKPPTMAAPAPAPSPSSTKIAGPGSTKIMSSNSTDSTSTTTAAQPQPASILLEASKPASFKMALSPSSDAAQSSTTAIENASTAPSSTKIPLASAAPAPPVASSTDIPPVAVPVSTKAIEVRPRSSKYTFKSIPDDVAASPQLEESFTDLIGKAPKPSSPAPVEEAPKSGKIDVSTAAAETLPSEEFLVSTPSATDASVWEDRIVIVNAKQLEEWDTQGSVVLRLESKELVDVSVDSSTSTVELSYGNTNPRSFSPHSICVYKMESNTDASKLEKTMKAILNASTKRLKCMSCQASFPMQKMLECAKCGKSTLVVFESGVSSSSAASSNVGSSSTSDAVDARTSSGSAGSSGSASRQSTYVASSSSSAPHVEDSMDATNIPMNRKIYTRTVFLQDQATGEMEEMHFYFPCYLVPFNTSVQKEQRATIVVSDNKMLIFVKRRARKGSVLAFGKSGREGVPAPSEEEYKDEELLATIPLRSLRRIVAGPFWQWLRVESALNTDAFMFLTRSHARTFRFLQAFKARCGWVEVSNKNKECLSNAQSAIQAVLRDSRASAAPLVAELDDFAIDLYFMAYQRIKSGFSLLNAVRASTMMPAMKDTTLVPRSIILTKHNILILDEDYAKWPSLAVANWVTPKTPQFNILHHYSYHDVVSISTVHPTDHPNFVSVTFEYNTSSGATSQQQIVLITQGEAERAKFISLLSQRYQEHFHIKLVPDQN